MRFDRPFVVSLLLVTGCGSAAPPTPHTAPTVPVAVDQKMSWILRLEDRRILRDPAPPPPAARVEAASPDNKKRKPPVTAPPPPPPPVADLTTLAGDAEARIRRRAALAIGRVGLPEGAPAVRVLLADPNAEVRQMAAFSLGLLHDTASVPQLTTALQDADPRVRGRAAEALGLIGDTGSAAAVGEMVGAYVKSGAIANLAPDEEKFGVSPEADAVRLGVFALVRQKGFEPLVAAVQDGGGRVQGWWPFAYALRRINDPRAIPLLRQLAATPGRYTRAFAVRGLGALKDTNSIPLLGSMLGQSKGDAALAASLVMALKDMGVPDAAPPIVALLAADKPNPNVALEAVAALGALRSQAGLPYVQDFVTDEWPTMRAAAIRASAHIDPAGFPTLLSGMEPDPHWIVRAAIAETLAGMPPAVAVARLQRLAEDPDKRVVAVALDSLTKLKAPGIDAVLLANLKASDVGVRTAAARNIGELKPAGGAEALRDAYQAAQADGSADAREAALAALVRYGAGEATATLNTALGDRDWALRLDAANLLHSLDSSAAPALAIRPVPGDPIAPYDSPDLVNPPYSPHAFIETARGTIEIELAVLDAPQTVRNFVTLARKGYFNGLQIHRVVPNFVVQDGDPRGDGTGGPGYTIRDELNDRPFVRGTVGMALSGPDTGGSQFFIVHSPQPHLDAKYTVFGQVVQGMDVVDTLQQLDVIERIRIWDGKEMK
ncbi:MAG TPA: HEAT repeat domain-containing protein [Vicinamibacterales bacterium]